MSPPLLTANSTPLPNGVQMLLRVPTLIKSPPALFAGIGTKFVANMATKATTATRAIESFGRWKEKVRSAENIGCPLQDLGVTNHGRRFRNLHVQRLLLTTRAHSDSCVTA